MKIKSIIISGALLLSVGAATTSCEDMFTVDDNLVTTNLAPQDTVYQVMGIVKRMQKLADRTVLLGEVRADLVTVDEAHAPSAIQELGRNVVTGTNVYNQPADYYDVINACNIYLAYVDSTRLYLPDMNYYDKEILAAKCFKAWCYLELVKIYGEVPFVDEPVLTADAAEEIVASGKKMAMEGVLTECINDLTDFMNGGRANRWSYNLSLRPSYGSQKWYNITFDNFFIPVRVMMAELYLWRGSCTGSRSDYLKAIGLYHDYFCFPNEERGVQSYMAYWDDRNFTRTVSSYGNRFMVSRTTENAAVLPCDTIEYFGTVNNIRSVFNSQYSNNYYPAATPSQRMKNISKMQEYCSYNIISGGDTTYTADHNVNDYDSPLQEGDLRLYWNYNTVSRRIENQTSSVYNNVNSFCTKWTNGDTRLTTDVKGQYIPLFRNTILYLHMAEALNRAGFPATAYLVLSRGLDLYTINDLPAHEYEALCTEIPVQGFTLVEAQYRSNYEGFTPETTSQFPYFDKEYKSYYKTAQENYEKDPEKYAAPQDYGQYLYGQTQNTFVIWPSEVFRHLFKVEETVNGVKNWKYMPYPYTSLNPDPYIKQTGIHSLGSGDTDCNEKYQLDDDETLAKLENEWPLVIPTVPKWDKKNDPDSVEYKAAMEDYYDAVETYRDNYNARIEYLASAPIQQKRIDRVKQMILDEEALEGVFEGYRFYDLMRYQLQEGKVGGAASAIVLPEYLTKFNEGWTDNMTGKPWYLTLPSR